MGTTAKRGLIFLVIALLIAFVCIPVYEMTFGDVLFHDIQQKIIKNLTFESVEIWKRVFTFYLALWCGTAILWALRTASLKQE